LLNRDPIGSLFHLPVGMQPRRHSTLVDKKLGFRINRVENKLSQKYRQYDLSMADGQQKGYFPDTEAWIGLDPAILQTPYSDIFKALNFIRGLDFEVSIIVDIGAAYGRVAFVKEELFQNAQFIGYEVVKKRQQEGQRVIDYHNLIDSHLIEQDVLDKGFELPQASIYFIYDFSETSDVSHILKKLSEINDLPFFLIAHGERALRLLEFQFQDYQKVHQVRKDSGLSVFYRPS
jgi:hypothetical protein